MGNKESTEASSDVPEFVQHSSHPEHELKRVHMNSEFKCKTCKTAGLGMRYRCESCDFNLHTICATCSESFPSYTHPEHQLQLHKTRIWHDCNLCRRTISLGATVYKCEDCGFYLHPVCSQLPELLPADHAIHPLHAMKLHEMSSEKCDVCSKSCKHWRYYCADCNVHIHVGCLNGKPAEDHENGGFGDILITTVIDVAVGAVVTSLSVL